MTQKFVEHFRRVADGFIERFEYDSAIFIIEKLLRLSEDDFKYSEDVERLCFCFYQLGEYHRVIAIIKSKDIVRKHLGCACLLIKSYLKIKNYNNGIDFATKLLESEQFTKDTNNHNKYWKTSIQYLLGLHYLALDNQVSGIENLKQSLKENYLCFEIFFSLVDRHLISIAQQRSLVNELISIETSSINAPSTSSSSSSKKKTNENEAFLKSFMKFFFYITLSKHTRPDKLEIYSPFHVFNDNPDVLVALSERFYYNCDYLTAFETIDELFQNDPFNMRVVLMRVSCLIEERRSNDLCVLGQYMINLYPKNEISWYILGAYYHLLNKPTLARSFLHKATMLNVNFAPAWLLCGHSFSQVQEHDQAISAFLRAAHYLPACHLPQLYVGIEYILTESYKLAERYVSRALELAPDDPFTLHELGIVAFHTNDILPAERHFRNALKSVMFSSQSRKRISLRYLSLFSNLGHVLRKLCKYNEAIEMHKKVLFLSPNSVQAHLSLGFLYAYRSEWSLAMHHLNLMLESNFSPKDLGNITENIIADVLKSCVNNEIIDDEPSELERQFSDKEFVDRLCNQAPIDAIKNSKYSRKKDHSISQD